MNRTSRTTDSTNAKRARFNAPLKAPLGAKLLAAKAAADAESKAEEKAAAEAKARAAAALKAAVAAEAKARAEAHAAAYRAKQAAEADRLRRLAERDQILDAPILEAYAGSEEEVLPGDIYEALARDLARGIPSVSRGKEVRVRVLPPDPKGKVPAARKRRVSR